MEEPTFLERITDGFGDSLEGLWESLQNLAVFVVVSSPYILVYGTIIFALLLLSRKLRKGKKLLRRRRKDAKAAEDENSENP